MGEWDVDFVVFSGYKMFGLFGIGVLWGREELLEVMLLFFGGGSMILIVIENGFIFGELLVKFEVGILVIVFVIGMKVVIDYFELVGLYMVVVYE